MHIAFLTPEYISYRNFSGGLASYLSKVSHALVERGHKVTVFVISNQNKKWKDGVVDVEEIRWTGNIILRAFSRVSMRFPKLISIFDLVRFLDRIWCSQRVAKKVWRQHSTNPIDIIQTSSFLTPGFSLRKNKHIPMVCRLSSYSPALRSGAGFNLTFGEYLLDWLEIRQVADSDAAYAPSKFLISLYNQIDPCKIDLLRTPVELSGIKSDNSFYDNELAGLSYLLTFGILNRIKGVDIIADIIPEILKKYPRMHFVFIGKNSIVSEGIETVEYIFQRNLKYSSHIHYFPPIRKEQLFPVIQHALGIVMPSRLDNYPNACLEAQMLGGLVIGTYNSSLDEMIENGKTGFLVENGNAQQLADAVLKVLGMESKEYLKMKKKNLERVQEILREDRIGQLESYLLSVIEKFKTDHEKQ